MRGFRLLLLCLLATTATARDAPRFALESLRAERTPDVSTSGRFALAADARGNAAPGPAAATPRFKLTIAPGCDPDHVFSNGFE